MDWLLSAKAAGAACVGSPLPIVVAEPLAASGAEYESSSVVGSEDGMLPTSSDIDAVELPEKSAALGIGANVASVDEGTAGSVVPAVTHRVTLASVRI